MLLVHTDIQRIVSIPFRERSTCNYSHTHINITVHEGTRWNVRVCSSNKPANEMYLSAVIRKYPRSRFRRCLGLIMNQLCLVERQLQLVSVCVLLYIRSIRFAFCTWRVWERLLVFLIWLVLYFFKCSFLYLVTIAVTRHVDSHSAVFQGFHLWNCLETVYSFHWQTWVSLLIECNSLSHRTASIYQHASPHPCKDLHRAAVVGVSESLTVLSMWQNKVINHDPNSEWCVVCCSKHNALFIGLD